jgi:hypothetical protein
VDLIRGASLNANGMGLRLSQLNLGERWMVETIAASAYCLVKPGKGWAVVVESPR